MEGPKVRERFLMVELRGPSEQGSRLLAQTANGKMSGCITVLCLPWSRPMEPQDASSSYMHPVSDAEVRDKAKDTGKKMEAWVELGDTGQERREGTRKSGGRVKTQEVAHPRSS